MTDLSQGQSTIETPENLSLTLAVPPVLNVKVLEGSSLLAEANEFVIDCKEMADIAAANMKTCRSMYEGIDVMRKEFLEPAALLVERAKKWFLPPINAAKEAEQVYKTKLIAYRKEVDEREAAERRQRDEDARRARQEADRKAAEIKAKADEEARQKREQALREARAREDAERREREAAEQARRAKEAGDREAQRKAEEERRNAEAEARSAALKEAKATEESLAVQENAEAKVNDLHMHAAAVATAPVATVTKVAGFSMRKNWKVRFARGYADENAVIRAIAAELPTRPDLVGLLKLDMSAANKLAKALEGATSLPGLEAFNDPTGTGR